MIPRADLVIGDGGVARCGWVGADAQYERYHDDEWGHALHGDQKLFEKLSLEGFQAGLSWISILRRRADFRIVFHDFDPAAVALLSLDEVNAMMLDERIIRNRAKILATIKNAQVVIELTAEKPGALDELMWSFAPPPRERAVTTLAQIPATTAESTAMSGALRALGFGFVGPTTMYALMQSSGMVDDHIRGCWRAV